MKTPARLSIFCAPLVLSTILCGCGASTNTGAGALGANGLGANGLGANGAVRSAATPNGAGAPGANGAALASRPTLAPVTVVLGAEIGAKRAFSHVWTTLHKIELVGVDNKTEATLFDDVEGIPLDLAALADGAVSLPGAGLPPESLKTPYTRLRVTFGQIVSTVADGSDQTVVGAFDDTIPRDATGRPNLFLMLERPAELEKGVAVIADLRQMTVVNGKVAFALKTVRGLPEARASLEFSGAIDSVSGDAPNQTFVVSARGGRRISVRADGATILSAIGDETRPELKNDAIATVRAQPDATGKGTLRATRITLGEPETSSASGAAKEIDAPSGTFTLDARQVSGLIPTRTKLSVTLTEKATLRSRGGLALSRADFFATLAQPETRVAVDGVYEPVTGAFLARRARLDGESLARREALVLGAMSAIDEKEKRFTIVAADEWDGFAPSAKGTVVRLTEATSVVDEKGLALELSALFGTLKERPVRVIGLLDNQGVLAATKIVALPAAEKKPEPPKTEPAKPESDKKAEPEKKSAEPEKKAEPATKPEKKPGETGASG